MSVKYIVFNKDSCWDFSGIDYRSEVSKLSARSILGIVFAFFLVWITARASLDSAHGAMNATLYFFISSIHDDRS